VKLYISGTCPVDGSIQNVYFAKIPSSGKIFFVCPMCKLAWSMPPEPTILDSLDDYKDYAPQGFWLPSRDDISRAALAHLIIGEEDLDKESLKKAILRMLAPGYEQAHGN